jgi:Cellulose-binding protein Sde0182, C-terminal domain
LKRSVKAGEKVVLNATQSSDPDNDALRFQWIVYPEAGSYRGPAVEIQNSRSPQASLTAPKVETPQTLHVVLIVADAGDPPLTRYKRLVLTVMSAGIERP